MEFLILTTDRVFAQALADWTPSEAGQQTAASAHGLEVGEVVHIPNAADTPWYEIVGLLAVPGGIAGSLIATWISDAMKLWKRDTKAKVVVQEGDWSMEVSLEGMSSENLADVMKHVLEQTHRK